VAGGVTDPLERFRLDYAPVLLRHLARRDESGLQAAYQLGRRAMQDSVGLLDVVRVHNDLFLELLATVRERDEAIDAAAAASTLLIDLVASFEVAQRGFMDVRRERLAAPGDADG
jgi:Phosphoserine phosphatase RsbU, N-terminal domain